MPSIQYRPTRRKPQKRNARQVSKPNAHSHPTHDLYHTPDRKYHITLFDVLSALVLVIFIVTLVWALGACYQVGYQAGLEWAAS